MRRLTSAAVSVVATAALALGSSVVSAPVASAAAPKSCTTLSGNWWFTEAPVGTPLYHFVVADKVVDGGEAAYFCVWLVSDRTIPGGHTSKLDISKPGKDIHVKSTKKWTLVTPKPFKIYAGTKFKAVANMTITDPTSKSGKHTVHRTLTVNLGPDGQVY